MEAQKQNQGIRTWVEVDRKALANNYKIFRGLIDPKCKLMAVCKSNAYGHGLVHYAQEMVKLGADFLGVDSMTEAMRLRKEGIKIPILILGYTMPEVYETAAEENISITISNIDSLKILKRVRDDKDGKFKIHIKIDTGMHRQGFFIEQLVKVIEELQSSKNIEVEGLFTHFAAAKNPAFPRDTQEQLNKFEEAVSLFKNAGFDPIRHTAASAGAIIFPHSHYDMVRVGISMMGLWPSLEVKSYAEDKLKLQPILSWRTFIAEIKTIEKGERISYDFTETLNKDSKIAIIPIGYWHGFRRNLSGIGHVLINGQRAKVLGRVTMDMIIVDITEIRDARPGDIITLIGRDGKDEITAYEMAALSDTSWYETITCLNPLMRRIYL